MRNLTMFSLRRQAAMAAVPGMSPRLSNHAGEPKASI